jgi:hypothetical protein
MSDYSAAATFTWPDTVVLPALCMEYSAFSCDYVSGPYNGELDLCEFGQINGQYDSEGAFDPETGTFQFGTTDMDLLPPGDYVFDIEICIGEVCYTIPFTMTMEDPCVEAQLSITDSPFAAEINYDLREVATEIPYDLETIGTKTTPASCDKPSIAFVTAEGEPLDERIFQVDYENHIFGIHSEDRDVIGVHEVKFRWFFTYSPDNYIESDVFTVTVQDLCVPGEDSDYEVPDFVVPQMEDQIYTISSEPLFYDIPMFTTEPAYCGSIIEMTLADMNIDSEVAAAIELSGSQFSVHIDSSLELAGDTAEGKKYPITINAGMGGKTASSTFNLIVMNPCLNSDFFDVNSDSDSVPSISYTAFNDTENSWETKQFSVDSTDHVKELCGELQYSTVVDDALAAIIDCDPVLGQCSIYTEDRSLVGEHPYSILSTVVSAPNEELENAEGTLTIEDPCDSPFYLSTAKGQDIDTDYTVPAEFTFPETTVAPAVCIEDAVFTCSYNSGPYEGDLCSEPGWTTFDPETGSFTFTSDDHEAFPPGEYDFVMGVEIGD